MSAAFKCKYLNAEFNYTQGCSKLTMIEPFRYTTHFFIFDEIWPFLKFSQMIGAFPYLKKTDEHGKVFLKRMSKCSSYSITTFWSLLNIAIFACNLLYIYYQNPDLFSGEFENPIKTLSFFTKFANQE